MCVVVYCISYDLINKKEYQKLYDKIKQSYGTYSHSLESTWFIETDDDAAMIRDKLKTVLDADDKIIVIEVIRHWASFNLRPGTGDWLKNRDF